MTIRLDRRAVIAGAAGLAATGAQAASADLRLRGLTTYSESAMIMVADAERGRALTLRLCRFPELGATWLWCHVLVDGKFFAFTQHDLPCERTRINGQRGPATYDIPSGQTARISRDLTADGIRRGAFSASLPFHMSRAAPHGPGGSPGELEGEFTPVHDLSSSARAGRTELMGQVRATFTVGGRRYEFAAPGKIHEQQQTEPRFIGAFCYTWLWTGAEGGVVVRYPAGVRGAWTLAGRDHVAETFDIGPPGPRRRLTMKLQDEAPQQVAIRALVEYQIPLFDQSWRGSFVAARAGTRLLGGVVNDWRPDLQSYAAT